MARIEDHNLKWILEIIDENHMGTRKHRLIQYPQLLFFTFTILSYSIVYLCENEFIRNKVAYKYVCRLYLIVRRVYDCVNINLYVIYFIILCIFQNKKKGTCSFNIYNIYLENKMYFDCTRFFRVIGN